MLTTVQQREILILVDAVSQLSNDASTKIGAILADDEGTIQTAGANNIPEGVNTDDDSRHERPKKYFFYEHAERNAIYAAAKNGICTEGLTLYTTGVPCADCARAAIRSGVSRVVAWEKALSPGATSRWEESRNAGLEMLHESNVEVVEIPRDEN